MIAPRTLVAFVAISIGGVLLCAMAYAAREILLQLLAAIMVAMALESPVRSLQRRGLKRGRAVAIVYVLVFLAACVFAVILLPPLVEGVANFVRSIPDLLQKLSQEYRRVGAFDQRFGIVEKIRAWMTQHGAESIGQPAFGFVREVLASQVAMVTISFLSLFVALDGSKWYEGFLQVVPDASRKRWRRMGSGVSKAVGGYVFGNVLISVIAGTYTTLVLLALGVPYAVPLGLVVGVLDLLPFVGASAGAAIAGTFALTKGLPAMLIVLAAMALYQEIENHTLIQLVYHRTVKLSALAIAVSGAAGAEIGGIPGALIAIPIAGALKVVGRELVAWRRGEEPVEEPVPAPRRRSWLPKSWSRAG